MAHLRHDGGLPLKHVGRRVFAAELQWVGQCGSDESAVGARQGDCPSSEMLLGNCFGAINAVPHLDAVEIDFHDALFAPKELDEDGEIRLQSLAKPTHFGPEKDVLGGLLRDSAAATEALAGTAFLEGFVDFDEVEAIVVQKALVLACHHGHRHVNAHRVERHPVVFEPKLFAATDLLGATNHHKRRHIDGTPPID